MVDNPYKPRVLNLRYKSTLTTSKSRIKNRIRLSKVKLRAIVDGTSN